MTTLDHRPSTTLNLFYANKTVPASMAGKWTKYGTGLVYLYGNALQVLFTGLGYTDFIAKFGPFAYDIVVALKAVQQPVLRNKTWLGVLQEWIGIATMDVSTIAPSKGDVFLILGVNASSDKSYRSRAAKLAKLFYNSGAKAIHIVKEGEKLPRDLIAPEGISGAYTSVRNAFFEQVVDNTVQRHAFNRIFLYGTDLTLVATAMGAVDHLLRRPGIGRDNLGSVAPQIIVDAHCPILSESVATYAQALEKLGILFLLPDAQLHIDLPHNNDLLQITPIQI